MKIDSRLLLCATLVFSVGMFPACTKDDAGKKALPDDSGRFAGDGQEMG